MDVGKLEGVKGKLSQSAFKYQEISWELDIYIKTANMTRTLGNISLNVTGEIHRSCRGIRLKSLKNLTLNLYIYEINFFNCDFTLNAVRIFYLWFKKVVSEWKILKLNENLLWIFK